MLALVYVFAAYAVIDGILTIAASVRNRAGNDRWWLGLLEGIVGIAAGVFAFLYPGPAAVATVFIIAFWAIVTGILEIVVAICLRKEIENEWTMGLLGALSVVLGIIMLVRPDAGLFGLIWAIAGYAILFGILMIILAIKAGQVTKTGTGARVYSK